MEKRMAGTAVAEPTTHMTGYDVLPHNAAAAKAWSAGGAKYDAISASISDAIGHCVTRLAPGRGERVLDVATGTGWAAFTAASRGARVTGIDIAEGLLDAAGESARRSGASVTFRLGDAESLPFADASFDAVLSTFGVMFTRDHGAAARELGRICRRGGRLALASWTPASAIAEYFRIFRGYMPPPASPAPSPFSWGDPERILALLGDSFDLRFETGVSVFRVPDPESAWSLFLTGYGPLKTLHEGLDASRREGLRREFMDLHAAYVNEVGVAMPREYLVAVGEKV